VFSVPSLAETVPAQAIFDRDEDFFRQSNGGIGIISGGFGHVSRIPGLYGPKAQLGKIVETRLDFPFVWKQILEHIKIVAFRYPQVKKGKNALYRFFRALLGKQTGMSGDAGLQLDRCVKVFFREPQPARGFPHYQLIGHKRPSLPAMRDRG
jgi:hypothetical protein